MNTRFTILIAAGLLIAGVSQAQGTAVAEFKPPHHTMVVKHRPAVVKHEVKKVPRHGKHHHHKVHRHHHKVVKHHHR